MKIDQNVSHYLVIEKLGGGGMGVVYKARDLKLDRFVALKFLPHHLDSDDHEMRFIQEAKTASALDHPNLCTIYEIDKTQEGQLFIAMGFYEGETLKKKLSKGKLHHSEAIDLAVQITHGLSKAHEHGVVHRDIKPANVIITHDGIVKIVDFGLARFVDDTHITKTGVAVGTLQYMSPEQAKGKQIDHRTDIWSVGVLLYEMLTGHLPFSSTTSIGLIQSIINDEPIPIRSFEPGIPERLEKIIRKAMAKPLQDRYVLMQQLAHDLEEVIFPSEQASGIKTISASISKSSSPSSGAEKRQLAIVISNLANYSEILEELPPEKMTKFVDQLHETVDLIASKHAAIVNKFSGDEIITLLGLPASQEDDFVRAIRFAIELHGEIKNVSALLDEQLARSARFHSGIGAGSVVAEWTGSGDQQYRISGAAVQTATRLAAEANENEILISSECQRVAAPYFEMKAHEPIVLQGKKEILPFSVLKESGLQSRLEAAEKTGLSPYTGREKELNSLKSALDSVKNGEGQLVTISGEAGIGKSRLLFEFRELLNLEQERIVQGRSLTYGKQVSYSPFIEAIRDLLSIAEISSSQSLDKEVVHRILNVDKALAEFIPIYLHILSIPSKGNSLPKHLAREDLRLAIQEALLAIFTSSAKTGPLILILEDWQWTDETSDDVLKQIIESLLNFPILLLITSRPEKVLNFGNLSQETSIRLGPLDRSSSRVIIESVFQADSVSDNLVATIHDHTGGNPFFIEELCHSLFESGKIQVQKGVAILTDKWENVPLPQTVDAVIRTRLDRLNVPDREVLRVASVAGREFSRLVLQRSIPDHSQLMRSLESLKSMGLIQQIAVVPEATYKFRQALTRQVVYESILPHQRKLLHGRVGEALEELYPDRQEEYSDLLAYHYGHAEEWRKAAEYGQRSSAKLSRLGQFCDAYDLLENSYQWLLKLPDDNYRKDHLVELLLTQERHCETLGMRERQQAIIDELLKLLKPEKDQKSIVDVYCRQADMYTLAGRYVEAEKIADEALLISKVAQDTEAQRKALRSMGFVRWHQERYDDAVSVLEQSLSIGLKTGHSGEIAGDLTSLGNILRHQAKFDRALSCLEQALQIYELQADPAKQCLTLYTIAAMHGQLENDEKFLQHMERALELSQKNRLCIQHTWNLLGFARFHQQHGDVEKSLNIYKEALEIAKKTRYAEGIMLSLRVLSEDLVAYGRDSEALTYLMDRAERLSEQGDYRTEVEVRKSIASIVERSGDYQEAIHNWNNVREIQNKLHDPAGELEALEALARLCRIQDSFPQQALEFYQEAVLIAQQCGDKSKEAILLNSIGVLEWTRGDYRNAIQYFKQALDLFEQLKDRTHQGVIWNSLGVTYTRLAEFEEASKSLEKGIELNRQTGQRLLEGHSWAGLGEVWHKLGNIQESLKCFEASLRLRQEIKDRKGEGWMLYELARIHHLQGDRDQTDQYLTRSVVIAKECNDKKLEEACRSLQSDRASG
jgi:serine/threonine protein kinase/predicted ATPase